jgi:hypothetical protein
VTANLQADQTATPPLSEEAQAFALWTFVQLKMPRFTSQKALAVVRELAPAPGEDAKQVARRLSAALSRNGVRLKHTNALVAASKLLGHGSWHSMPAQPTAGPLRVYSRGQENATTVPGWREAIEMVVRRCEALLAGGRMKVFRIQLMSTALVLEQPYSEHESAGTAVEFERVVWDSQDPCQLAAAVRAAESIRRHFEETARALVDGVAAAHYCLHSPHAQNWHSDDPMNSELVVDLFGGAGGPEEVARGDELRCWHELHWFHKEVLPEVTEQGEWVFETSRYGWSLGTIRANVPVPEIIRRPLSIDESQQLRRRYLLAARAGLKFLPEDRVKRLRAMEGDVFQVDVDWQRVHQYMSEMRKSRVQLEETFPEFNGRGRLERADFEALVNWLQLQRPQDIIRKPKRSELALLKNDEMIRAFVSRVQDVVHEVPRGLSDGQMKELEEAVGMLYLGLRPHDVLTPEGKTVEFEPPRSAPYLLHANAGEDLLACLKKFSLVAYAGLTTNVKRGSPLDWVTDPYPFELQHVLFLDIDYAEVRNETH